MHQHPRIGVGVCVIKEGNILRGKRKGSHGEGTWQRPGGHLEFGETREECAIREVTEEAGITIKNIQFMTATNDIHTQENKHYNTILLVCEYADGEVQNLEPHKLEYREWRARSDLPSPLFLPIKNMIHRGISPLDMVLR